MIVREGLPLLFLLSAGALGIQGGHREGDGILEDTSDQGSSRETSDDRHRHRAHSFQRFSGPVSGRHREVGWRDEHGHPRHDYRAHPEYEFHYGVEDDRTEDHHGQSEHRDGKELSGEYRVHEPGGNARTVEYRSDHHGGFFAVVENHGGNDHSGGTYGGR